MKLHRSGRKQLNKGFTLLEVLIALAIVATGILAILGSITQSMQNQSKLQELMIATWVAENRVAYLKSLDDDLFSGSGYEDMAGRRWRYRERVEGTSNINLQKITIEVFSDSRRKNPAGVFTTYIPKPEREALE